MAVYSGGISALLIVSTAALGLPAAGQTGGLTCSSSDGEYHYCRADTENQVEGDDTVSATFIVGHYLSFMPVGRR
jgi:hypothetical protein